MNNITAVILTKNEELNIKECLSCLNFCNEIIIVDDYSKDNTLKIISDQKTKTRVYQRKLNNNFSEQRNFGLSKVRTEWVLFIDADERVNKNLSKEIIKTIYDSSNTCEGFYIRRQDYIFDKKINHGEFGTIKILRLFKRKNGKWIREVHEYVNLNGQTGIINNILFHYPHPNLTGFISDINFYSTLHAGANEKESKKSSVFKIVFYPVFKFINNYFIKLGFLDGVEGLVLSFLMSFHSFLSWSKLWEKQKQLNH